MSKFGVQHGATGGSTMRVVPEQRELDSKDRTRSDAPDMHRHASILLNIEPRLGPVGLQVYTNWDSWSAWKMKLLRFRLPISHRLSYLFN